MRLFYPVTVLLVKLKHLQWHIMGMQLLDEETIWPSVFPEISGVWFIPLSRIVQVNSHGSLMATLSSICKHFSAFPVKITFVADHFYKRYYIWDNLAPVFVPLLWVYVCTHISVWQCIFNGSLWKLHTTINKKSHIEQSNHSSAQNIDIIFIISLNHQQVTVSSNLKKKVSHNFNNFCSFREQSNRYEWTTIHSPFVSACFSSS